MSRQCADTGQSIGWTIRLTQSLKVRTPVGGATYLTGVKKGPRSVVTSRGGKANIEGKHNHERSGTDAV